MQPAPTVPRGKSLRILWIVLASFGALLLVCCVGSVLLGLFVQVGTKKTAAVSSPLTSPSSPVKTASPRPTSSQTPASTPAGPAPTTPATKPPTKPDYAAAASILKEAEQHYRDQLAQGQQAFNTAAFASWFQRESLDVQPVQDAFKQADAMFTADNEPTSIMAWQEDMIYATSAFFQWTNTALSAESGSGGPGVPTDEMRNYVREFEDRMAKTDQDAANVAAGR